MDAFFALEGGYAIFAWSDGLAGAHRNTGLFAASNAKFCVTEGDVIGESRHGLDLTAHQQSILMRDKKAAIEWNLRPATRREQGVVKRAPIGDSQAHCLFQV